MLRRIRAAVAIISALRPISIHGGLQRVGPLTDGGYLIPADLENVNHCISPGVGHTTAFEDDLLDRFGIASTLVDVAVPPACRHRHVEALLGVNDATKTVSLATLLKDARRDFGHGGLLLQMDIEGGE